MPYHTVTVLSLGLHGPAVEASRLSGLSMRRTISEKTVLNRFWSAT